MDPQLISLVNVVNELWHMQHAQDWKVFASLMSFLISFTTATFMFYDIIRGKKRKLAGTRMHNIIISLSITFYMIATFCFIRFLDGIQDLAFLLANPEVQTTLSQRSVILEVPLIGFAATNMVFLVLYATAYFKMPYSNGEK